MGRYILEVEPPPSPHRHDTPARPVKAYFGSIWECGTCGKWSQWRLLDFYDYQMYNEQWVEMTDREIKKLKKKGLIPAEFV